MITITRNQARELRAVLRRGFGRTPQGNFTGALLAAASGAITAWAWNDSLAVEYRARGATGEGQALVPFDVLENCQARSQDPVNFDWSERGGLAAQWTDKGIAQLAARPTGKLPTPPQFFGAESEVSRCSADLWPALSEAAATSASEPARFALNTVQLRGDVGEVVATDGRQVLVQGGFRFPWPDSVLIPASRLFSGREIVADAEVAIGVTGDWVSFGTGQWTVWLKQMTDRKYPDVRQVIPVMDGCPSRLDVSDTDAAFLIDTLPSLPVDNETNLPITLDLNGRVLVRARPAADGPVTQLKLAGSHLTGSPIRISTNRDYLLRALRLDFRRFAFQSPHAPVVCGDELRQYVWAVLSPEDAIKAGNVGQELSAPSGGSSAPTTTTKSNQPRSPVKPRQTRSTAATSAAAEQSMAEPSADAPAAVAALVPADPANSVSKTKVPAAGKSNGAAKRTTTLDHALHVRSLLRETLVQMDGLVSTLRQQRKQSQLVRSTLKSLRQLERVAG